ncbi:MAG: DMT family transporter [Mycobacterium sp.]|nr:DMT family transporter [Mycobacterium sp.]
MHDSDVAAALALGAALFIAVGDVCQQRSAHEVTDEPVGHVALMLRLLRDQRWWVGSVLATAGFGLQAAALGFGSVLLVQALLVTSMLFALPLSARFSGRPITRSQLVWALALTIAIAVVVTVGDPAAGQSRASTQTWAWVAAILGTALALCLLAARILAERPAAAVLLGLVSGSLWGVFAVLTKGIVDGLDRGMGAMLTMPETYGWAAVGVVATTLQQSAFRAGTMAASLPAVAVSEPLVGSVLGVTVLGEEFRPGRSGWVGLVLAVAVMVVATAVLARSQASAESASPDAVHAK